MKRCSQQLGDGVHRAGGRVCCIHQARCAAARLGSPGVIGLLRRLAQWATRCPSSAPAARKAMWRSRSSDLTAW